MAGVRLEGVGSKAVVGISTNPAQGLVCANETGELRGDASEPVSPDVPVYLVGVLQKPEGISPRAGATHGDVAGRGALIAGELKHC
jgi:hypothetical protein